MNFAKSCHLVQNADLFTFYKTSDLGLDSLFYSVRIELMLDHGLRFALNSVHLVRNPLSLDCATPDSHRDIGAGSNVVEILFLFFHYYFVSLKPFITKITDFNWVLLGTV